jgi:hypothetical protein
MAAENVALQVNFKLVDGTLINIYAKDAKDLESQLTTVQDSSSLITSVVKSLNDAAGMNVAVSNVKAAFPTSAPINGDSPTCAHGSMQFREGVGSKGPWKGWMCAAPKGSVPKCETVWVR